MVYTLFFVNQIYFISVLARYKKFYIILYLYYSVIGWNASVWMVVRLSLTIHWKLLQISMAKGEKVSKKARQCYRTDSIDNTPRQDTGHIILLNTVHIASTTARTRTTKAHQDCTSCPRTKHWGKNHSLKSFFCLFLSLNLVWERSKFLVALTCQLLELNVSVKNVPIFKRSTLVSVTR